MPDFIFNLAPVPQLTVDQQRAWLDPHPVLVTGGPGTGKTVVSIYRFLSSLIRSQNSLFFTYNRTLMASIKGLLKQRSDELLAEIPVEQRIPLINSSINSLFEWYYANTKGYFENETEENIAENINNFINHERDGNKYIDIHIDEAQDLMPRIIKSLNQLSDKVNCGADRAQDLQGNFELAADVMIQEILDCFCETHLKPLDRNFRNTKQIFDFARNFVLEDPRVANIPIQNLLDGEYPEVFGGLKEEEQLEKIWEIVEGSQSNIGIIVFSVKDINKIRDFFRQKKDFTDFSYYYSLMPYSDKKEMENQFKTPFIITFESCKGLEFDTVIMPFFQKASWAIKTPKKDKDDNLQYNADGSIQMICTMNHYYVSATRARKLLYILYDWETKIFDNFETPMYKLNDELVNFD